MLGWTFFTENLNFCKVSLIHEWLSRTVHSQEGLEPAHRPLQSHRQDQGVYTYYSTHGWVRLLSGFLVYCAISHSSHKCTLWVDAKLLLWMRDTTRDILFSHVADVTLKHTLNSYRFFPNWKMYFVPVLYSPSPVTTELIPHSGLPRFLFILIKFWHCFISLL